MLCQKTNRLIITLIDKAQHLIVNLSRRILSAVQSGPAIQVLALDSGQPHHAELVGHAEAGNHGPGNIGGLFDVIGRAGGHGAKDHHLGGAPTHQSGNTGLQLLLGLQEFLLLGSLQGIAQGPHGSGHNGNLLHRLRILLQGSQ